MAEGVDFPGLPENSLGEVAAGEGRPAAEAGDPQAAAAEVGSSFHLERAGQVRRVRQSVVEALRVAWAAIRTARVEGLLHLY